MAGLDRSSSAASTGWVAQSAGSVLLGVLLFALGIGAGYVWFAPSAEADLGSSKAVPQISREVPVPRTQYSPNRTDAGATSTHPDQATALQSLAQLADVTSEFDQSAALYQLAAPLDAQGILSLLQRVRETLDGSDSIAAGSILVGRYAELDFPAALEFVLDNGGDVRAIWLRSIFHAQARLDLDDAIERANELTPNFRQLAGLAILRSNQGLSPAERRSIAERLGVPPQMVAVAERDVGQAWQDALNISDPQQRNQTLSTVAMTWGKSDPMAALRGTESISNSALRRAVESQLLAMAASENPQAAVDWLDSQPEGKQRLDATKTLIQALGSNQFDLSQSLLARLPESAQREVELSQWTQRAASDPEGAAAWIASRGESPRNFPNMESQQLIMILNMTAPESVDRFVNALPEAERARIEPSYIRSLVDRDPQAAAARVEQIRSDTQRQAAATSLVGQWAQSDPQATQRWIRSQPTDEAGPLYTSFARAWALSDVAAAEAFAGQMRAGLNRDQFNAALVSSRQLDSDSAQRIIERIDDAKLRQQATTLRAAFQRNLDNVRALQGGLRIDN